MTMNFLVLHLCELCTVFYLLIYTCSSMVNLNFYIAIVLMSHRSNVCLFIVLASMYPQRKKDVSNVLGNLKAENREKNNT